VKEVHNFVRNSKEFGAKLFKFSLKNQRNSSSLVEVLGLLTNFVLEFLAETLKFHGRSLNFSLGAHRNLEAKLKNFPYKNLLNL
jgi:hypothetical protein